MAGSQPIGDDQRSATADSSWMLSTGAGIGAIWLAVVFISIFSPDFVSGSEQQHMPVAAFTAWFWGVVATIALLIFMGRLRGDAAKRLIWVGYSIAVAVIWLVAVLVSVATPTFETGTDPTTIPVGAVFAPVAAALLTILAGVVASVFGNPPESG